MMGGDSQEVRYLGYIVGTFHGIEPLTDYGMDHGCHTIEFEAGGRWVPLPDWKK